MSLEVIFIIAILMVPTYFFSNRLLKKLRVGKEKYRYLLAVIPTLVIAPVIYFLAILIWIFSVSFYVEKDFDKNEWAQNVEERFKMSEDIIESKLLIGKSKEEVILLLGEEYIEDADGSMSYYLGHVPGMFNIDPDYIYIEFGNGKVVEVNQFES